jgi:AcrR family transcriptional regulator
MSTHTVGQRGPAEHARREQIIEAANEHFRHYGYAKTTVADLAKAIGLSTAYIYKFFDSKKAIGEAICGICLGKMLADLQEVADDGKSAADRLRRFFRVLAHGGSELFFHDRKQFAAQSPATSRRIDGPPPTAPYIRHKGQRLFLVKRGRR